MANKVPYEILSVEVEKLYLVQFPKGTSNKVIDDHCLKIQTLIEGAGWEPDEYINRWCKGESN